MEQKNLNNLNQHTFERKDFAFKIVNDKAMQIMSNIILIVNCRHETNPNYLQNKNHWKGELRAICLKYRDYKLKNNNSIDAREKNIRFAVLEECEILSPDVLASHVFELNDIENTHIIISNKFNNELHKHIDNLIRLCAEADITELRKYINKM